MLTLNNTTKIIVIGPQRLVTHIQVKSVNFGLELMERPIYIKFNI